jgi:sec-independent protein translocase protein TatA
MIINFFPFPGNIFMITIDFYDKGNKMSIGVGQLILIIIAALLLFGGGRVSGLMEDLAKGIKAFKKGMADEDQEGQKLLPPSSDPKA